MLAPMQKRRRSGVAPILVVVVVATVALVAPSGPVGAARRTEMVPDGVAHDCSVDVTKRLGRWIAGVPDGSTIEFARDGCYRVDGSLVVEDRSDLTFEGNGATLRADTPGDRGRRHLWFVGGENLVVRDLTVRGANPHAGATLQAYDEEKAFQHAFTFSGVTGARLEHVQAYDTYGDFVYIGEGGKDDQGNRRWSSDITVTDSTFARSGRQGIAITSGEHITIEHNTITDVARSMFDLEANSPEGGALDVLVQDNVTGAAVNFWLANKGGGKVHDVRFVGNRMKARTGGLVFIFAPKDRGYRGPFLFKDNTLLVGNTVNDEGSKGAFFLSQVKDVTIEGNRATFPKGADMPAVERQDAPRTVVNDNTFKNAGPLFIDTVRPSED